jgi:hypothetical protein
VTRAVLIARDEYLDNEEREEVANALNEVYSYIRTVSHNVSGLDGWHSDALLMAASFIRPPEVSS